MFETVKFSLLAIFLVFALPAISNDIVPDNVTLEYVENDDCKACHEFASTDPVYFISIDEREITQTNQNRYRSTEQNGVFIDTVNDFSADIDTISNSTVNASFEVGW